MGVRPTMAWIARVLWKSFGWFLLYLNDLALESQVRVAILHFGGGDCRVFRVAVLQACLSPDLSLLADCRMASSCESYVVENGHVNAGVKLSSAATVLREKAKRQAKARLAQQQKTN
jgi:hypothetical protein